MMKVTALKDEDVVNYKKCSMFVGTSKCSFKCCIEQGLPISTCQNALLGNVDVHDVSAAELVKRYMSNTLTQAVVIGGLEPFDTFFEVYEFVSELRKCCDDDVVIYTGYNEDEIADKLKLLEQFPNIIVKFGRFVANGQLVKDEVLGVMLASQNQHAVRIS